MDYLEALYQSFELIPEGGRYFVDTHKILLCFYILPHKNVAEVFSKPTHRPKTSKRRFECEYEYVRHP